jgi:phosphoglycerate dehydrogenase-like enzyme
MLIYKATNTLDGYLTSLEYTEDMAEAEIILVGGKKFDLDDFPKLRGVFKTGVGTDNLPFAEANARGIKVELPSEKTCDIIFEETAAFTCHLILKGLYAEAGAWDTWAKADRQALHQKKLLVVGTGRIGQRVTDKMKSFLEVDTFDTAHDAAEVFESKVRVADCVSIHVPLNEETSRLFNAERLAWMPGNALLVNTARGPVVDEDDLYQELSTGRLRAAMDVFWEEPYRGKLTELPAERFIRTPHIASTCKEFIQGTAEDFLKFLQKLSKS